MKNQKKVILGIVIIIVGLIAAYFTFFYTKDCKDAACFNTAIINCEKAYYLEDAKDAAWQYTIEGKSSDRCIISTNLAQIKEGNIDMAGMEGLSMTCSVPLGSVSRPQENLENCHGLLKEEMQDLIIKRLHNYITENLGKISSELEKAF